MVPKWNSFPPELSATFHGFLQQTELHPSNRRRFISSCPWDEDQSSSHWWIFSLNKWFFTNTLNNVTVSITLVKDPLTENQSADDLILINYFSRLWSWVGENMSLFIWASLIWTFAASLCFLKNQNKLNLFRFWTLVMRWQFWSRDWYF